MTAPRASWLILLVWCLLSTSAMAQTGDDSADEPEQSEGAPDRSDEGASADDENVERETPQARLDRAQQAFREAEYEKLVPVLGPVVEDELDALTEDQRSDARQLYAVGLFFRAQQAPTAADRDALIDNARAIFLAILRENPDFQLDTLLYPASVVELFDDVVEANAAELTVLRAKLRGNDGESAEIETVYIQREATRNRFPLIFLPFAVGQFQNDDLIKGTLLASVQPTALALNFTSFVVIESLRNQGDGRYNVESGNYANALAWRNVLYGSLVTFGIAYVISVVDAWSFFEEYDVNIRTLDGPPPELTDVPGSESTQVPLGFSLDFAW